MSDVATDHVDLLTGAYRREHLEALAASEATRAHRAGLPVSVLHLDLDDATELNDVHGREAVDEAFGRLTAQVAAEVDGRGPIGRTGGGALTVVLPGVGRAAAVQIAERIRQAVKRSLGAPKLTVSIGVATRKTAEPVGNLLEAAQLACQRAKQGGRDTVAAR